MLNQLHKTAMHRNVLFDMIVEDMILCDGNYELGAYDMELVHDMEPERSRIISKYN